jgi:hypothetical protein
MQESRILAWVYQVAGLTKPSELVIWFGLFIVIVFIVKSVFIF